MITLHRLNGSKFMLNPDHIELMEETPDTIITLMNDKKYMVKEKSQDVLNLIVEYNKSINVNVKKMVVHEIAEND